MSLTLLTALMGHSARKANLSVTRIPTTFGLRFGLAWDINGNSKNIVRVGGGIFYSDEPHRQVSVLAIEIDKPQSVVVDSVDYPNLRFPVNVEDLDPTKFGD